MDGDQAERKKTMGIGPDNVLTFDPHPEPATPTQNPRYGTLVRAMQIYLETLEQLRRGPFEVFLRFMPPHLAGPVRLYLVAVSGGVFMRWIRDDAIANSTVYLVCCTDADWRDMLPLLSCGYLRVDGYESDFTRGIPLLSAGLYVCRPDGSEVSKVASSEPVRYFVPSALPANKHASFRPFAALALSGGITIGMSGAPTNSTTEGANAAHFTATIPNHPFEWAEIDFYEDAEAARWTSEIAPAVAERDMLWVATRVAAEQNSRLLSVLVSQNQWFWAALEDLERLIKEDCKEEALHQHIKAHPWLLAFNAKRVISKLAFGSSVSDFVVEHADGRYELVELERPSLRLFTQRGEPTSDLNHALNQIRDWVRYLTDNKSTVERELGLVDISPQCARLVVIGRSENLTEENRRTLREIEGEPRNLRICTWDEFANIARAALLRAYGSSAKSFPPGTTVVVR